MREILHLLVREAGELVPFYPRPRADVGHAVLALSVAGQVLARLARVLAREADLDDAEDAEGFVAEAVDCDYLGRRK